MATPAQVTAALSISNRFTLFNSTAPINTGQYTDTTDWAGLGYSSGAGDTVKIITQIINPIGQVPYQNTGYQTDTYTSPDSTLTSLTAALFTLLNYTGTTTPVYGAYTFNLKVQVTPNGSSAFYVTKSFTINLIGGLKPILSLEETWSCNNATYTSTDTTVYGSVGGFNPQTVVRTHTVYPPEAAMAPGNPPLGQTSVTANAAVIILSAPNNQLWANATYSASLSAVITYAQGANFVVVNCARIDVEQYVLCDNSLCKLMCCLNGLVDKFTFQKGRGNTVLYNQYFTQWQIGSAWLAVIANAIECTPDKVSDYTAQFYTDTGCDPNCDCGCDAHPFPVIPTSNITGPTGPAGPQGPQGPAGPTGPTGATGAAGGLLLVSDGANHLTTNTSLQTLSSFTTDHTNASKNLVNVGDSFKLYALFTMVNNPTALAIAMKLNVNGVGLSNIVINGYETYNSNNGQMELVTTITLVDNTAGAMVLRVNSEINIYNNGSYLIEQPSSKIAINNIGGATVDFSANDYTFSAQAQSVATGDVQLQLYQAEKLRLI